jgi:hypothetical protein
VYRVCENAFAATVTGVESKRPASSCSYQVKKTDFTAIINSSNSQTLVHRSCGIVLIAAVTQWTAASIANALLFTI